MVNRRLLMMASVSTATMVGLSSASWATTLRIANPNLQHSVSPRLDHSLSLQNFTLLLSQRFRLHDDIGKSVEACLISVRDEGCCAELEQFSLVFRVPPDEDLRETIYTLAHRRAGRCSLLLSPSGEDRHGQYLTAVIASLQVAEV